MPRMNNLSQDTIRRGEVNFIDASRTARTSFSTNPKMIPIVYQICRRPGSLVCSQSENRPPHTPGPHMFDTRSALYRAHMRSRSTIRKKALLFVATVLVCELVFVGTLASTLAGAQKEAQKYRHARDVISILDRLAQRIQHSAAIMLTMVDASYEQQVNDPLLAQYQEERAAIPKDFRALHALVESDPFEESKVKELETICSSGLALIEKCRHDLPGAPAPNLVYQYKLVLGEKAREFAGKSDEIIDSYTKIQE